MTGFSVKLKTKNGHFVLKDLSPETTIADLKTKIAHLTKIEKPLLHVLIGFPPKPLDLTKNSEKIGPSGITSGDTLIVEEKPSDGGASSSSSHTDSLLQTLEDDAALARRLQAEEEAEQLRELQQQQMSNDALGIRDSVPSSAISVNSNSSAHTQGRSGNFDGILLKKVVPADNSCLFTSIGFVLNGKVAIDCGEFMRRIIAQEVASDPTAYNEAFLGKPNPEYCTWIQRPDSWGGAIEVSILSNFYGIEIDVVDIRNAIINRFGEDKNYGLRVFLLFDGIHYDPLYMESPTSDAPATLFPIEEIGVYQQAEQLASEANSSRQFTDVDRFTLRCLQCDVMLVGQVQAQQHAKLTGHANFGEI